MASGAPVAAKTRTAKTAPNPLRLGVMGGCSQVKIGGAPYAQAAPPSLNGGAINVLEQRAYFSAWSMVFEVPSWMSAGMRALPCGPGPGFSEINRAFGA